MSITVTINADNGEQLQLLLHGLLSATAAALPIEAPQAPEKPKATRSTKAKSEPVKQDTEAASAGLPSGEEPASSQSEAGQTAPTDASPSDEVQRDLSPEALKKRGMAYAAKAGPQASIEMVKTAGSASGKFSELDAEGLAKLDALLADMGY